MDAINHIEIALAAHQVKPVLRTLLYAIFFQRNLEPVEPVTQELLDVHVACGPSSAVEKEVSDKVDEFGRKYLDHGQVHGVDKGELALIFTQKRPRKGWFGITEELVPWEAHFITLQFTRSSSPVKPVALSEALMQILTFCAERKNVIPTVPPGEGDRLSHQILVSPPPPSDLFAPSPPLPARSPPPVTTTTTTALAHALARDLTLPSSSAADEAREATAPSGRRASSPGFSLAGREGRDDRREGRERDGAMGYLEHAKDVLRATGARAGAVTGWTGRGRGG